MCNINHTSSVALLSDHGTQAGENGTQFFNSNALRSYNAEGKRRRKPSSSSAMRQQFIISLTGMYPDIRKIKVHDTGIFFSARVWMYGGRIVHKQAYSLQNLYGLLNEGIRECREAKRVRCTLNFMSRYPDATVLPAYLASKQ